MSTLSLYSLFHLNISFSSIEDTQRREVIRRCYWPLLRLAADLDVPLCIEASGYTLEVIANLDSAWIGELRRLCVEGPCEFVGSGYAQIIGPLVPARVNRANQSVGLQVYKRFLGFRPHVALVAEQTFSSGMVRHYVDAGYEAIVMEWDNPASVHKAWLSEWRYSPQIACDQSCNRIRLIWNHSIPFQKFQRYAHGELEEKEYLDYLASHLSEESRALCLYGNDAEVFDFRPGRFATEAEMGSDSEWGRIRELYRALDSDPRFELVGLEQLRTEADESLAGEELHLESADQPIPTKKQHKYNVTRWAVTGRDDLSINTTCWRIYDTLAKRTEGEDGEEWKELCYLWSSDFRTHITAKRWEAFRVRLAELEQRVCGSSKRPSQIPKHDPPPARPTAQTRRAEARQRFLEIETSEVQLRLDTWKGLAIETLRFPTRADRSLCGTIPHGYFDDISLGADFFSGHLVFEMPGRAKVTDLTAAQPSVFQSDDAPWVEVTSRCPTSLGLVVKTLRVFKRKPRIELAYRLDWDDFPIGNLRLGYVTLNPATFDRRSLFFRTHNGGFAPECFPIGGRPVDHGSAVSFLVSARQALGITGGFVELGDAHKALRVEVDKATAALIGMITYREIGDTYFLRLALSAGEMDETSRSDGHRETRTPRVFSLALETAE